MSIRVGEPLFLLSAQTGMSVNELRAMAAEGNPQVEKPQEALKTGEPIPIIFCRRTDANKGGVMIQPKMTEARFSNPLVKEQFGTGVGTTINVFNIVRLKYRLVLGEGDMEQLQIRDCFYGNSRRGSWNQKYNGAAGTWNPGNAIDDHFDSVLSLSTDSFGNQYYDIPAFSDFSEGESVRAGSRVYYGLDGAGDVKIIEYKESSFPAFCGTGGTYGGLTTISFEYSVRESKADKIEKTVSVFVRNGLKVTRLVDSVTGGSDNYVDLVKYLFEANGRLDSDLIDTSSLTIAANFTNANGFFFNGKLEKSQNLLDWLQKTSVNFLLRLSNSGGKFGLLPRLPYNTDRTINTGQVTPEFTFTEEHVLDGGFEIEYISLEDREPVCFVVQWRQQPDADFGLVRTVQVRYQNEAANGPFVSIDMSDYCTSEDHAVKAGTYRLAQRKFVTHHLRLTVRERSYNSTLVVGDLVRVRLRRETSEGQVEYHDKMYEINRIEKTFESRIVYDLTHFPIDSQGRSIVARAVDAASGAGNIINVGRSTFDGDENSSTNTSTIGTSSGGGGTVPSEDDTEQEITDPGEQDSSYPDKPNNPTDPIDEALPGACTTISGNENPVSPGDELTYDPCCTNARIEWYVVDSQTNEAELVASGVAEKFIVAETANTAGKSVYAIGCCPDPSAPGGYGQCKQSDTITLNGQSDSLASGECIKVTGGTGTIGYVDTNGDLAPVYFVGDTNYNDSRVIVELLYTEVRQYLSSGIYRWLAGVHYKYDDNCDGVVNSGTGFLFVSFANTEAGEAAARAWRWGLMLDRTDAYAPACPGGTCAATG
jgi:hypothetical protein